MNKLTDVNELKLPENITRAIDIINAGGFSAYAVGGCVRDMLLGKTPDDYDVTSSATPKEITSLFCENYNVIPTGIEHGTVTVVFNNEPIEITTYRTEGQYSDHRHPDSVVFTRTLEEDLSRRDFTINAMAYNPREGIADPFGGMDDLENGIIRAVGNAETRFTEDALRIYRAIRFSAVLGFDIEENTASAVRKLSPTLKFVATERLGKELKKLLTAKNCADVIRKYKEVIFTVIPELKAEDGCEQHSVFHQYDVFEHTLKAMEHCPDDLSIRCAVLFHDIGKPYVKKTDDKGFDHFKGHVEESVKLTDKILKRFAFPAEIKEEVHYMILHHEEKVPLSKARIKLLLKAGNEEYVKKLFKLQLADNLAKTDKVAAELADSEQKALVLLNEITENQECCSLTQLEIRGNELLNIGSEDREISTLLDLLLLAVVSGKTENQHDKLLEAARNFLKIIHTDGFSFVPLRKECTSFYKRYREYLGETGSTSGSY